MSVRPTISVVLSCYNSQHVLQQLRSLREQSEPADELIVVDDSTDDSLFAHIRDELRLHTGRVLLTRNETNLGMHRSYTYALGAATCDVVATCDHDDVWMPEKLRTIRDWMGDESLCGVASDAAIFRSETECPSLQGDGYESLLSSNGLGNRARSRTGDFDLRQLLRGNPFSGATLAVRRSVLDKALPLPLDFFPDYWLVLCAAASGPFRLIPRPLIWYRVHENNTVGLDEGKISWRCLSRPFAEIDPATVDRMRDSWPCHSALVNDWEWFMRWRSTLRSGTFTDLGVFARHPRTTLRAWRRFYRNPRRLAADIVRLFQVLVRRNRIEAVPQLQ